MRKKNKESIKKPWLVLSIIFLFFIILGIFGYSTLKEIRKKNQIEKDINSLKQEAEKIKKENMALEERISYLGSDDYREIQAKSKLNLQNPNENLIVITQEPIKKEEEKFKENMIRIQESEEIPNYQKWWNYFFKN